MLGIVVAFIAGYVMGMYEEDGTAVPNDDMIADVRENAMVYHDAVSGDDYGFHKRK